MLFFLLWGSGSNLFGLWPLMTGCIYYIHLYLWYESYVWIIFRPVVKQAENRKYEQQLVGLSLKLNLDEKTHNNRQTDDVWNY